MSWKAWSHFKTITYHKYLVARGCFEVGLYRQGLLHDLSKYSPTEFVVGAKYYQGTRSPNNAEREAIGYSSAWLHHKGRNRHHYEYWIDYNWKGELIPCPMPAKYLTELIMDRIAASKVYEGKNYTDASALAYYNNRDSSENIYIHEQTKAQIEMLLTMLAQKGEKETFAYIRKEVLKK